MTFKKQSDVKKPEIGVYGIKEQSATKRFAIVAATRREIQPLITKGWKRSWVEQHAQTFTTFEDHRAIVIVGGMGMAAAGVAAEGLYRAMNGEISTMVSVGFAGALSPELKVGDLVSPVEVFLPEASAADVAYSGLSARKQGPLPANGRSGRLVTAPAILSSAEKVRLERDSHAIAVDMEAYAVAEVAQLHGLPFVALKVISDERDFAMPPFHLFIDEQGIFHTSKLLAYSLFRPAMWPSLRALRRNSEVAAARLATAVSELIAGGSLNHLDLRQGTSRISVKE